MSAGISVALRSLSGSGRLLAMLALAGSGVLAFSDAAAQALPPSATEVSPSVNTEVSSLIHTGCGYDAWTGSVRRSITDLEVPGAVSSLGLKWARTYNSGNAENPWSFSWTWFRWGRGWGGDAIAVHLPDGGIWRVIEPGMKLRWVESCPSCGGGYCSSCGVGTADLYLEDGSKVHMDVSREPPEPDQRPPRDYWIDHYTPTYVDDPYGRRTTLQYEEMCGTQYQGLIRLKQVTDPSGRWIKITYACDQNPNDCNCDVFTWWKITRVDGSDGSWVSYTPDAFAPTQVDYSDGTHAYYAYGNTTYLMDSVCCPGGNCQNCTIPATASKLITAQDTHADSPMQSINYEYANPGRFQGQIQTEHHFASNAPVSTFTSTSCPTHSWSQSPDCPTATQTEMRGDGPSRTIYMEQAAQHVPLVKRKSDFYGVNEVFTYDSNNYLLTAQDRNRNTTTYTNEPVIGNPTRITHPGDGTHIDYTYSDPSNPYHIHTVSDERGNTTTYTRDGNNRITQIDYPDGGNETFAYNNFGQVWKHRRKNGAYEYAAYDGTGLLIKLWNATSTDYGNSLPPDSDPHITLTYYSASPTPHPWQDRVQTVTYPATGIGQVPSETYEYDRAFAGGITDPNGAPVHGRGLVTKITHADGNFQRFGYDAYGNRRWEDNELAPPKRTTYTYDEYKRLLTVTDALYETTTYDYSPTRGDTTQCYRHTTNSPYYVTTPTGIVTNNGYDQNFRKTSTIAAYGTSLAATTWFHYDPVGNQDCVTDPRGTGPCSSGYTTTTDYDARNRKWHVWDAQGNETIFTYDGASNVTRIDHPDTGWEQKSYDAVNRVLSDSVLKTNTPSQVVLTTWFTYNPSGTLSAVTDARGSGPGDPNYTTTFAYDASDQKISMTYPNNGGTQQWAWDNVHNPKWRITVNNEDKYFYYDSRNRLYATWWSNWNNGIVDWRYFGYDPASRLTEAENGTGGWGKNVISDVHRSYDDANHLTQEQQNLTNIGSAFVNYGYDADGKLNHLWVNGVSDYDYTFSYDAMGRFEKIYITNPSVQLFQYHYDAASNEIERDNVYIPNWVKQIYPRDALNRMLYMDVMLGNNRLAHEGYGYNGPDGAMNRLTSVDYGNGHTDSFSYYRDGELNQAQYGNFNHTVNFNLDNAGNRTSVVDNNITTSYTPNFINQYTAVSGSTITNGNEHEISGYNSATYTYINDERLTSVGGGGITYSMFYDALGRCVERTLHTGFSVGLSTTTLYIYDGEKPILEYDGTSIARVGFNLYGKGIDEILERGANGTDNQWHWYFLQQNHEGSVTHLTDASGNVIEQYRYDAFGVPTIQGPPPNYTQLSATAYDNRFLFTGREYAATFRSANTGFNFYEYRARAYSPTLGRFMSEDPKLLDAGDYNLFRYCHNDPLDLTDPMGLTDIPTTHQEDLAGRDAAVNSFHHAREMLQMGTDRTPQDYGQAVRTINGRREASGPFFKENSTTVHQFQGRFKTFPAKQEIIKAPARAGEYPTVGHVHHDVTGRPPSSPNASTLDEQAARSARVYRLNESNPNVTWRAVPQKEGTAPVDRPFETSTMKPLGSNPKLPKMKIQEGSVQPPTRQ